MCFYSNLSTLLTSAGSPSYVFWDMGPNGRSRLNITTEQLNELFEIGLSVSYVSNILGVSKSTIHRRMRQYGIQLSSMGCVVRRKYSVPGPLCMQHIDTSHKLIRYNIVIFGGIDGFSRKVSPEFDFKYIVFTVHGVSLTSEIKPANRISLQELVRL
ncbi:hypothetical protein NFI96_015882 [Prochilodus magdalenae]|nr:hypothetical protein NFI96_015882 [Prochilodus magdalenae]